VVCRVVSEAKNVRVFPAILRRNGVGRGKLDHRGSLDVCDV